MNETEYVLQGENGKRIKESIKQLDGGEVVDGRELNSYHNSFGYILVY